MASELSGRGNLSGSKGFDFGSDDILCSYEDYGNQESSNGSHAEAALGSTTTSSSTAEWHDQYFQLMHTVNQMIRCTQM
ncbi:hypothetical protein Gogos_002285 [Gossypium gossypioides]|uniref:Uncharacterized protein n=1 Tax=Gossypium gossypioides TaxID=34282 RepID=A0A7J9CQY0_GOSGO|nr:hypothetical protein [Gossypium gossypioides]